MADLVYQENQPKIEIKDLFKPYVNFEKNSFKLDNGEAVPSKKYFIDPEFCGRTFCGKIDWSPSSSNAIKL